MGRIVGIDLGTTNSVVAVMEGGKPVVIANVEGGRTTPSVVGFNKDGERLVGQLARRQSVLDPKHTYYNIKRFIGRNYAELSEEDKRVPYPIRRTPEGNVRIAVPRLEREFAPEELAAMILRKLADEASRYLGQPVTGAVITVPAYFNDSQRQATRDAGRIAGLDVKRILNEPTAASLAYGLDRRNNQTILVFDLGGGTFDVSILKAGNGVFEVKATCGDTQLGGNDFDRKIVNWLAEQFVEQEGIDLRRDRQALQRLTEAAEKAKIELSGVGITEINLPFIYATEDGPKHLATRLTRGEFESLCSDLLDRLRTPVRQALRDASLSPRQIDEIVLVGGSTRMPMVQELVRSFINREPCQNVNPDEVVAVGAAVQSGIIAGDVQDVMLLDVTPLSVGLETIGGVMKCLIPRNTPIPVRRSDIFSTGENNQTMVEIHVLQGEREIAQGNKSLGRFKLTGIPPAPRGVPQIQVAFDVDSNGILQVSALDRTTGREQTVTIQGASTLSEAEIDRMIQEADEYAQEDRQKKAKVEKRNQAESLASQAERKLREVAIDYGLYFADVKRKEVDRLAREVRQALQSGDDRAIDLAQADLQDALAELTREIKRRLADEDEDDLFQPLRDTFESVKSTVQEVLGGGDDEFDRRDYSRREADWRGMDSFGSARGDWRGQGSDAWGGSQGAGQGGFGGGGSGGRSSGGRGYGGGYGESNYGGDPPEFGQANRDARFRGAGAEAYRRGGASSGYGYEDDFEDVDELDERSWSGRPGNAYGGGSGGSDGGRSRASGSRGSYEVGSGSGSGDDRYGGDGRSNYGDAGYEASRYGASRSDASRYEASRYDDRYNSGYDAGARGSGYDDSGYGSSGSGSAGYDERRRPPARPSDGSRDSSRDSSSRNRPTEPSSAYDDDWDDDEYV